MAIEVVKGAPMILNDIDPLDPRFFELLTGSYRTIVGRHLVDENAGPKWLYHDAPFVVVAHNRDSEPKFVYANKAAQNCFGYEWDEFVTLKSKLSARPAERDERQALLDEVSRNGYIANYRGLRVRKSGDRFWMEDGLVWLLKDAYGELHGQAAVFSKWTPE